MKTIKEYIYQKADGTILCDFDEFVKENKIENPDMDTYKKFLEVFDYDKYKYDNEFSYNKYQESLYIFERLGKSWSAKKLADEIKNIYPVSKIDFLNNKESTQFSLYMDNPDDFLKNEKVMILLRLYNYYIRKISDDKVTFEPYKPEDVTDMIYNDCGGIIYHVTTEEKWKKIKDTELVPKYKHVYGEFRDARIFFIANKDEKESLRQLRSISNTNPILRKSRVFIKVNLNKYKNRLRFRIDPSAYGYNAYFTEEPVPGFCMEEIYL